MLRTLIAITTLVMIVCSGVYAQCDQSSSNNIAEFFRGIVGEWVGVCKQSTDGQAAEEKYFHAQISESSPGLFSAGFEYYRLDDNGAPVRIGSSSVIATVSPLGYTATSRITGDGEVLVDRKPKKARHDLTESMTSVKPGYIDATGSGTLKVQGMPLGLGKLGKVRNDKSEWSLSNDKLIIHQSMNIVFRALLFSKSFKVDASYTAVRGSDILSQIPKQSPVAAKIGGG